MFYAVTALLLEIPGQSFKRHATVITMFRRHWVNAGRIEPDYHRWLVSAFEARTKADYFSRQTSTKEDADLHMLRTDAMIRRIRELLQS